LELSKKNETALDLMSQPGYWIERIKDDLRSPVRDGFVKDIVLAKELVTGNLSLGLQTDEDWYKRSTYIKILQHLTGRLAFGPMKPRFIGIETEDYDIAQMYQAVTLHEFTSKRGLHNKVGRRQLRKVFEDWINYGMGCMNVYFDPRFRNRENFTGSIICEAIDSEELILDSTVKHISDIGHISRQYQKNRAEVEWMYPWLDPEKIPYDDKGNCYLSEVQFRTSTPIKGRMTNEDVYSETRDSRSYWDDAEEQLFKESYKNGSKLWDGMKIDYYYTPIAYRFCFLSRENKIDEQNPEHSLPIAPPVNIGSDFSFCLIPFLHQPGTPYPAGAPHFVYDDQRFEALMMTLYMQIMKRVNNSGRIINLDKVVGDSEEEKTDEVRRFQENIGYPLLGKDFMNANEVMAQLQIQAPTPAMAGIAQDARYEANELFNTHREQTGQSPFAGAAARLVENLQATGSAPLAHMVDSEKALLEDIFTRIAFLAREFMPADKKVMLANLDPMKEIFEIKKDALKKYNPLELDVRVELDTDGIQEKAQKKQESFLLFDRGLLPPKELLLAAGYEEGKVAKIMKETRDWMRGQMLVKLEKEDPNLAAANDEYISTKMLQAGVKQ
jgi:hypothetical protein